MKVPDARQLARSLASTTCPACGGRKKQRQTLCFGCYRRLPAAVKAALYDRIGEGYEEALADAMSHLRRSTFILPPAEGNQPCLGKDARPLWDGTAT